jgi:hypothetical protein
MKGKQKIMNELDILKIMKQIRYISLFKKIFGFSKQIKLQ